MKKSIFSVAMALVAGLFASCGTSAPKANLEGASKVDSLSYAIGMAQTQGLKDYLVARMGMDTTYMSQFVEGVLEAADADDKKNAYYSGTQIGQQVVNQIIPGVTMQVFAGKDGKLNAIDKVQGRKRALRTIADKAAENIDDPANADVTIIHADAPEDAARLEKLLRERIPGLENVAVEYVGPVIGAHCGPGTVAVCFFGKERPY